MHDQDRDRDREYESPYQAIYAVIRAIPEGRVATYGQVATLAGMAGRARQVGQALRRCGPDSTVPWQRVVNSQGRVSQRRHSGGEGSEPLQRAMLEAEGVEFTRTGRIDLERYRWDPGPEAMMRRRSVARKRRR